MAIKSMSGEVTFEAIAPNEVSKLEKSLMEEYAAAYKVYLEARKDNPSEAKPIKPAVVIIEKVVRGKDKAEALVTKLKEQYEAKQAKKQGVEPAPADEKPTADKAS
ncbi:MAG TPA: hypothetical protein PLE19_19035 [Planctomycetota bacterium]|nr:hypothetical protein [Planctomycetota bacterium]HRR80445.1 hypothetical protein [Planctomycetota bacterium]